MHRMMWRWGTGVLEQVSKTCVDGIISNETYQSVVWQAHREITGERVALKVSLVDDSDALCAHMSHWGRGKRWFDIVVQDEGWLNLNGERYHWMVQPLGNPVEDYSSAWSEFEDKLLASGVIEIDGGARQFVEVDGDIRLVDFGAYVWPEVDFTPKEREFAAEAVEMLRKSSPLSETYQWWTTMVDGEENQLLRIYIKRMVQCEPQEQSWGYSGPSDF